VSAAMKVLMPPNFWARVLPSSFGSAQSITKNLFDIHGHPIKSKVEKKQKQKEIPIDI